NNRVAITIAIDSREVIVVLTPDPDRPNLSDVLYRDADGNIVQLLVDTRGRPLTATVDGRVLEFSNYSGSSVDVRDSDTSPRNQFQRIQTTPSTTQIREDILSLLGQVRPASADEND